MSNSELESLGYTCLRTLPNGEVAGLMNMLFTTGLFIGLRSNGYRIRYCYSEWNQAADALASWDGCGDPPGPWLKAKGDGIDQLGPGALQHA